MGTPALLFDDKGERRYEQQLDIYGGVAAADGWREDMQFRYPGQYEDLETGLRYNRFRYYDAEEGVYLSQDPIGLAGGNPTLYGYVGDVNGAVDVFGLKSCGLGKQQRKRLRSIEDKAEDVGESGLPFAVSRRKMNQLGKAFVGEGYTTTRGKMHGELWLKSADGKRLFRSPTKKKRSPYARTGVQGNFHQRSNTKADFFDSQQSSNVHIHMKT